MRSAFVECPRKFYWEYLHHFKPVTQSVHLHAGKAWASALEKTRDAYYNNGESPTNAIAAGLSTLVSDYGDFTPAEKGSGAS